MIAKVDDRFAANNIVNELAPWAEEDNISDDLSERSV